MKISTKTIVTLGIIQCIILTLILVLFLRLGKAAEETSRPVTSDSMTPGEHGVTPVPATALPLDESPSPPGEEAPAPKAPHETKEYPDGIEPV